MRRIPALRHSIAARRLTPKDRAAVEGLVAVIVQFARSWLDGQIVNLLESVKLTPLMERASGRPEIMVGLIDGPVALNHPDLTDGNIREVPGTGAGLCARDSSVACVHGTFVAGILFAKRDSPAPAICPGCTLLVCPIFADTVVANADLPGAKPQELAQAILACIEAGARVLNVSAAMAQPSSRSERTLEEVLDQAARRGVIVVAAAGNQGTLGSTAITRHPWVILDLIRFRGHLPKGGYDVPTDGRHPQAPAPPALH